MKRLIDELGPSARRDVLASAEGDERFRTEARARALAAGLEALGAAAAPGEGENSSPEATNRTEPGQASRETGGGAGTSTIAKGVGKAVVATALTIGAVALVLAVSERGTTTSTKETPPASAAPLREPLVNGSPTPSASPTPLASEAFQPTPPSRPSAVRRSTPNSSDPAAAPRARPSSDSPEAGRDDVLAREVRTIAAARAALAAGDPALALRDLDAYDRISNARALRPESRVLRLEALAKAKRDKEARVLATTLRADPEMAGYGRRIDAVLERLPSTEGVP